ncbi:hypothetical protein MmiHf6_00370 [Methanimicrococcus hongohii]|uniref:DUF1638 domain-containing protein n=1 Tax=Methanimicrococcus hongohii TaxID=3028295 RepID=A0AA96UY47_9EURY|nr:DUF1638 domain-containing protein [Methanimicrococcus sp. Hf6]WNY22752.1 hypothetical protein MmiHf6_00370 [Methanimicrococcus sp. Hf6]
MKTIGILNCKILQDEILYLIETHPEIKEITVIENGVQEEFLQKLNKIGRQYKTVPSIHSLPDAQPPETGKNADDSYSVIIWNVELGLHSIPKKLKENIYENLEQFAPKVNGIFLMYGLCGNVLGNAEEDFKDILPVVILKEANGSVVDDCVGATLGGRTQYLNLLKSFKGVGTLIYTPMFSCSPLADFFMYPEGMFTDEQIYDMNKMMLDGANYQYVAKLHTGLEYTENFDENIQNVADLYNLKVIELEGGSQTIFENCFNELKLKLNI